MNKKLFTLLYLTLFFLIGLNVKKAFTQNLKIGVIDYHSILVKMPEMKAVEQRIQNLIEKKRNELLEMQSEYEKAISDYQEKVNVISSDQLLLEQEKVRQLQQKINKFQLQAQQEVESSQNTWMEPLLNKIENAAQEIADSKDIDLLLTISSNSINSTVLTKNVLYMNEDLKDELNVTQEIIELLEF